MRNQIRELELAPLIICVAPVRFPVGTHTIEYTLVEGNHKVTCSFIVRVDGEFSHGGRACQDDGL